MRGRRLRGVLCLGAVLTIGLTAVGCAGTPELDAAHTTVTASGGNSSLPPDYSRTWRVEATAAEVHVTRHDGPAGMDDDHTAEAPSQWPDIVKRLQVLSTADGLGAGDPPCVGAEGVSMILDDGDHRIEYYVSACSEAGPDAKQAMKDVESAVAPLLAAVDG